MKVTVTHVNDGPAPWDVTASDDSGGAELRLRFDGPAHPQIQVGDTITVTYKLNPLPETEGATP